MPKKSHKSTDLRPVMARLPESLRSRLEKAAKRNDRSMNSEMVVRLESSFEPPKLDLFTMLANSLEEARGQPPLTGLLEIDSMASFNNTLMRALEQLLPEIETLHMTFKGNKRTTTSAKGT